MAFKEKTAFEPRIVNNRFEDLVNITGKYIFPSEPADCSAGILCTRIDLLDCEGFAGVKNENAWTVENAAAGTKIDTPVYACNTHDSQLISNGTNEYFVGHKTLGLGVPAGRYGVFTRIDFDNQSVYRFGEGNINGEFSAETQYYTIEGGLLEPATAAPTAAGSIYFKTMGTGNFVEGTTEAFAYVDLMACKVTA